MHRSICTIMRFLPKVLRKRGAIQKAQRFFLLRAASPEYNVLQKPWKLPELPLPGLFDRKILDIRDGRDDFPDGGLKMRHMRGIFQKTKVNIGKAR